MLYTLSQISGYTSLLFVAISYFCKNKSKFLIFQSISDIFYAMAYLFINIYVAGIITIISSIRCIVFHLFEKKNISHFKITLPIFLSLNMLITILFWQSTSDIIPLITSIVYTLIFVFKNTQLIRYISIIPSVALCIYNIYFRLYGIALLDILEIVVLIVSIIYFARTKHKKSESL